MRTKEQCFRVVCFLLKLLLIKYFKYICFSYLCNVIEFINLINNNASIIVTIIKTCFIKIYNKCYALNSLKY